MKKSNIFIVLGCFLAATIYIACNKNFLDKKDANTINSESYYKTVAEAVTASNSVYASLQRLGLYSRQMFFVLDFSSDEAAPTANTQTPNQQLLGYSWDASHEHINAFWNDSYILIARANIVAIKVPKTPTKNDDEKKVINRAVAEARFLRALGYLNLVVNFGGVPLRTDANFDSAIVAKSGPDKIYAQIEEDLKFAKANLPESYDNDNRGRVTKGAASGLLGKVYVYQKKWDLAIAELEPFKTSSVYGLMDNRRLNHSAEAENNKESLFEVQYTGKLNGGGGGWAHDQNTGWGGNPESGFRPIEYGTDGHAFYNAKPSDALVNAFETGDPRREIYLFGPGSRFVLPNGDADKTPDNTYSKVFARAGWAWKKYQNDDLTSTGSREVDDGDINIRVLRLADVYLLLAEAYIEKGRIADAAALINAIREKAEPSKTILVPRSTAASSTQMRDWLIQERRVEMCGEQQRRIDLVRWGIARQVLGTKFVTGKHEVFPIPQDEVDKSKGAVPQNPNY